MERQFFENLEDNLLSPLAVKSKNSRGREYSEPESINRTCFQRDIDRIIHSKAFRRLKHKTQVFISHETDHDHYRSRLTHTIEVTQIARHLARLLRVNEDLAEAIASAHDLGHTPFGHAGEKELNLLMADFGGFEHNFQSKRLVEKLEHPYPNFPGLNLSFEIRAGLDKHHQSKTINATGFKSLEADLVNLADEIAYNNHDLDDGLNSGLIKEPYLRQNSTLWQEAIKEINNKYTNIQEDQLIHLSISFLISSQIINIITTTKNNIQKFNLKTFEDFQQCSEIVTSFSTEMQAKNQELKHFLQQNLYLNPEILKKTEEGQKIINFLFKFYQKKPGIIEQSFTINPEDPLERSIADYIAGMTDPYAKREYEKRYCV